MVYRALIVVLAALAAAGGLWAHVQGHRLSEARAEALKAQEAQRLRDEGLLVAAQTRAAELKQAADQVPGLMSQLVKLKAAKVRVVERLVTKTVPAQGTGPCVLAPGDPVRFRVDVAEVETKAGNTVVAGKVQLDHVPVTEGPIAAAPFDATLSSVKSAAPERTVERARLALRLGPQWTKVRQLPTGAFAGSDLRILGPAWITADVRADVNSKASFAAGLRWEW